MKFWIRERHNPQLGVYYIKHGKMSKAAAKRYEDGTIYGRDYMLGFDTESAYNAKLEELEKAGEKVQ